MVRGQQCHMEMCLRYVKTDLHRENWQYMYFTTIVHHSPAFDGHRATSHSATLLCAKVAARFFDDIVFAQLVVHGNVHLVGCVAT
jgi:hypothetical protein